MVSACCCAFSFFLTIVSLWGGVSPVVGLGCRASLSIAAVLAVVAGVVVAGLGVFFQLLGQVWPRRAGGNVVFEAVLRNLQLLDETHRPGRQPEAKEAGFVCKVSLHHSASLIEVTRVNIINMFPKAKIAMNKIRLVLYLWFMLRFQCHSASLINIWQLEVNLNDQNIEKSYQIWFHSYLASIVSEIYNFHCTVWHPQCIWTCCTNDWKLFQIIC